VSGEIEFAGAEAPFAEFALEISAQIEDGDAVAMGIGDEQLAAENNDPGGALKMIGDLEQEFAGGIERQDTGERGIGDVEDSPASGDGDGGSETNATDLVPALPFHFRAVVEAHAVCAGVGQAEVVVFIEG